MIALMKMMWKCLNSPRLYKIYREGPMDAMYKPQFIEKWADKYIATANTIFNLALFTSPCIGLYVYYRNYTYDEYLSVLNFFGGFGCVLAIAFILRAFGRATNPRYVRFLRSLQRQRNQTPEDYLTVVRNYDFDFSAWPASYWVTSETRTRWMSRNPSEVLIDANVPYYKQILIKFLAFISVRTFALSLIYPGSLRFIHRLLWLPIFQGRANLVEQSNGQRAKLKTVDGNVIDTMFVDNRWLNINGEILVVCCEGNSGFYEVGIMSSPIRAGYSTLGWNHPGFAESTGKPYPSQEHNAINAVIQYAMHKLQFKLNHIVMYGWSIGGYTAAWAATKYPVRGVLLDAPFDDLLPLAQNQMPNSWSLLVKEVVRSYVNLHVAEVLKSYSGPIQVVRRTDDEIICLNPGHSGTNRGNYLLLEVIRQRHPSLIENHLGLVIHYINMMEERRPMLENVLEEDHALVLGHVNQYTRDFNSSHCTPLSNDVFTAAMDKLLGRKK